ncbi:hypothetical protein BS78_07G015800 [Paspalum vaginatum]|nr:hypothetical protein BS78_07G015800 [Paspalum vaginatum]
MPMDPLSTSYTPMRPSPQQFPPMPLPSMSCPPMGTPPMPHPSMSYQPMSPSPSMSFTPIRPQTTGFNLFQGIQDQALNFSDMEDEQQHVLGASQLGVLHCLRHRMPHRLLWSRHGHIESICLLIL